MIDRARERATELARNGWIEAVPTVEITRSGRITGYKQRFFRWDENGNQVWHGESKPLPRPALPYRDSEPEPLDELPF